MERLCRDTLVDPLRVVVGELGEANTDVTQHVFVFPETEDKWGWLATRLVQFTSSEAVWGECVCVCVCVCMCVCCVCVCVVCIVYVCVWCVCVCVCTIAPNDIKDTLMGTGIVT